MATAGPVVVDGTQGGTVAIGSYTPTVGNVTVQNNGAITGNTGTLKSSGNFNLVTGTISAALGDAAGHSAGLLKTTPGTFTLSNTTASTYSGGTTVSGGGTLAIGSSTGAGHRRGNPQRRHARHRSRRAPGLVAQFYQDNNVIANTYGANHNPLTLAQISAVLPATPNTTANTTANGNATLNFPDNTYTTGPFGKILPAGDFLHRQLRRADAGLLYRARQRHLLRADRQRQRQHDVADPARQRRNRSGEQRRLAGCHLGSKRRLCRSPRALCTP